MHIRPLRDADSIEELTRLLHRAYAVLGRMGLNYTAIDQSPGTTRERIGHGQCFVAVDGEAIVGTLLVDTTVPNELGGYIGRPEVASLHQFAVAPECQGRGIGSRMLEHAERWARERGFGEMALDTAEPAKHLVDFYARRGYRQVGTVQWTGKRYRSAIMTKPLPSIAAGG